jgi:hypothetical protein
MPVSPCVSPFVNQSWPCPVLSPVLVWGLSMGVHCESTHCVLAGLRAGSYLIGLSGGFFVAALLRRTRALLALVECRTLMCVCSVQLEYDTSRHALMRCVLNARMSGGSCCCRCAQARPRLSCSVRSRATIFFYGHIGTACVACKTWWVHLFVWCCKGDPAQTSD